ncbi:pre T-cell antigen receptor alpha isoform X3 [Homo sapiens]|uniref:pre T-cell antigen receptor alpha isoform X3 n=1 Tax=Homo sapiens TaxID=9606 RepID=UPI000D0C8D24|nr:pre T-cell antigen receptor alpha isoform X3 [Homo sapiens]XP_054210379.1 pre T-cell antigen receptor alpha isoform X3 [Homo sapiens]|eukprot:XP_024302113.1 pre T-cell antigen receptor alpha isoform X4 [Homo sapiens]
MEDRWLIEERMDKQVWAAHPFLLWPHQSCCWWMESSRWWWSAWSLMLHPLALTAPSGSQPAMAVHWMPSPMALPQQRMAPGPTWPISPCLLRSWHPGSLWSATLGLGLRVTAGVHSPCICQERLLQPGPAPRSLSGLPVRPRGPAAFPRNHHPPASPRLPSTAPGHGDWGTRGHQLTQTPASGPPLG